VFHRRGKRGGKRAIISCRESRAPEAGQKRKKMERRKWISVSLIISLNKKIMASSLMKGLCEGKKKGEEKSISC